ncbi:division/cell wall cluster transcriptional repressor MraZ [Methylacidimicrobium tartarophylax]|uniref:Transcriptional regulator MraZ n=1 Tax=Methylacidimicrobium tartarophylax TaxID=1041768 RepID=A0A5E6M5K5_9BACT|nr:division/cell wall cluster transcriptional repressor MraZ [Methylacidimicrobium tartarophylax]VVM04598.1 Transcriptional regulator MraZ [Methylacidimicrobium tartarophylax]
MNANYTDTFEHAFDDKGRITIPSEWRQEGYEARLFAFPSRSSCLKVYPESWLARLQERVSNLSFQDPSRQQVEALARIAQMVGWDQQGRIGVKERLRKQAALRREAVLAGCFDHFEIWSAEAWRALQPGPANLEDVMEKMGL